MKHWVPCISNIDGRLHPCFTEIHGPSLQLPAIRLSSSAQTPPAWRMVLARWSNSKSMGSTPPLIQTNSCGCAQSTCTSRSASPAEDRVVSWAINGPTGIRSFLPAKPRSPKPMDGKVVPKVECSRHELLQRIKGLKIDPNSELLAVKTQALDLRRSQTRYCRYPCLASKSTFVPTKASSSGPQK